MQYKIIVLADLPQRKDPRQRRATISEQGLAFAREMLSAISGRPPETLRLIRDAHGKPQLADGNLHFNISHSGDRVLCAVHTAPIGVDIEQPRPYNDRVARRICTPAEYAYIGGDAARFLAVWTRKEAYAKWDGRGLSLGLHHIQVADRAALLPEIRGVKVMTAQADGYVFSIVFSE